MQKSIQPKDILSHHENTAIFNGVEVRKGSIAAFLKNIEIVEDSNISESNKIAAYDTMKELAPALIATKFYKYATFKNPVVQNILETENEKLMSLSKK